VIRKLFVSSLMALTLLFVAACGGGPATPAGSGNAASGGGQAQPEAGKPTAAAQPEQAAKPTTAPATEAGGETRDIQDIGGSLDALNSYRMRFSFKFDGKDDQDKPQQGGMEFVQEIIKDRKDQHIRFSATGDTAQGSGKNGAFELYQVDGTSYMFSPDGQVEQKCIGVTSGQNSLDTSAPFKPSDVVGGLRDARLVNKGETVNGVVADHYTFDEKAISFGAFASAKGDAWVAQDGGFLVKYVGTATGKNSILAGRSGEGTFTWEYNVEDANQVAAIALPKECEGQKPAADIPMPDNATDKTSLGKLITFKTPDAPADVAAFYKKQLPQQGWKAGEANVMGDLQTLAFSKDGRKLSVTITKEDAGGSNVLISEEQGS
jgi:hypothetical protein